MVSRSTTSINAAPGAMSRPRTIRSLRSSVACDDPSDSEEGGTVRSNVDAYSLEQLAKIRSNEVDVVIPLVELDPR